MFGLEPDVVVTSSGTGSTAAAVLTIVLIVAYLAFVISAIVSIVKSTAYPTGLKALWILIVFVTPFIGSVVWFIWGKKGMA